MSEHPLFRMWKERLDAERAQEEARARRREERQREKMGWYEAWRSYKERLSQPPAKIPLPRWWNLIGWIRWLMHLHAPGRHH